MTRSWIVLFASFLSFIFYVVIGEYEFSAVFFTFFFLVFVFASIYLLDKYLVPEFDTLEEIGNGNIAVAIYFLALAILAGCAIIAGSGALGFLASP